MTLDKQLEEIVSNAHRAASERGRNDKLTVMQIKAAFESTGWGYKGPDYVRFKLEFEDGEVQSHKATRKNTNIKANKDGTISPKDPGKPFRYYSDFSGDDPWPDPSPNAKERVTEL